MGPTWVLSAPDGPHVGPMNLAIRDANVQLSEMDEAASMGYGSKSIYNYIQISQWPMS